jgi:uncharacterized membrane protein
VIKDVFGIIAVLLAVEAGVLYLAEHKKTAKFFSFLPPMFWIYLVPAMLSTFNVIPAGNDVYRAISLNLLPMSLLLLLVSSDMRAVSKVGAKALIIMLAGSAGILAGGPLVYFMAKGFLPEGMWAGFGMLAASWTGGSANMIAVKEGLGAPENIFTSMVVVDTIVPYVWMGILIAGAVHQAAFDKWTRADRKVLDELKKRFEGAEAVLTRPASTRHLVGMIAFAAVLSYIAASLAGAMPEIKGFFSAYTWTIIIISFAGIGLSFTPARRLEEVGASKAGYALLYFVLASIGARASLADIKGAPVLILAGFLWVGIHACFILAAARALKAPLFLAAAASQANIGGTASAPVVAACYERHLAAVGLVLAILGNIIGTYIGIACAHLCRMIS